MQHLKVYSSQINKANGPGLRLCVWLAGCGLGCSGCINAHINAKDAPGDMMTIDQVMALIKDAQSQNIEGVSFSGGEPLAQKKVLTQLLKRIKEETTLTTLIYTGLEWEEITGMRDSEFLSYTDILLSGRFDSARFSHNKPLTHKTIKCLTDAYTRRQVIKSYMTGTEVTIDLNGNVTLTGVNSMSLLETK